jgi:hypothetical protein
VLSWFKKLHNIQAPGTGEIVMRRRLILKSQRFLEAGCNLQTLAVVVVVEIAASYEMDIIPEKKRNVSSLHSKWIHTISLTLAFPLKNWNYFFCFGGDSGDIAILI